MASSGRLNVERFIWSRRGEKNGDLSPFACPREKKWHPHLVRARSESSKESSLQLQSHSVTGNFSFLHFFFPTITGRTRSNRAKATVIDMKAGFKMTVCHTESSFPTENISTEKGSAKDNPIWRQGPRNLWAFMIFTSLLAKRSRWGIQGDGFPWLWWGANRKELCP